MVNIDHDWSNSAAHEIGHMLFWGKIRQLEHVQTQYWNEYQDVTMDDFIPLSPTETKKRTLHFDDIDGLHNAYGY